MTKRTFAGASRVTSRVPPVRWHGAKGLRGFQVAVLAAFCLLSISAMAHAQQMTFPGGAQSVSEAFSDWRVACGIQNDRKRCLISQQQAEPRTRKRLLAIELQPKAGNADGVLVMPFGLSLDKGVILKLADKNVSTLRFSTCLPQGCVVPLDFDAKMVAALKKAPALQLEAVSDVGQAQKFSISLNGFGAALDRAAALTLK